MTHKLLSLALGASLVLGAFSVAGAHTSTVTDADDTTSALDLASAKLSHSRTSYKGRVATHDAFTNQVLGTPGDMYVDLDLAGRKRFDHYVLINRTTRKLTGKVYKIGRMRALGRVTVKRVDTKTLAFSFSKSLVKRTKKTVGFRARSRWQQPPDAYGVSTLLTDKTARGSHRF
jgi:hypothetical protein